MEKKKLINNLKEGQRRVKAVHNCPVCQAYLKKIKEHEADGHKYP
jgi:ssDNA-binding Zn-finger/Zn-ribbon topoisomerase 1